MRGAVAVEFPQEGGCLCGAARYSLGEDPLTLYVCHCTDCQRQTGTSFALSMLVRREALRLIRGELQEYSLTLPDGRRKRSNFCGACTTRLWGLSRVAGLAVLEPGTLDDTSWLRPIGHIWTRSAQPWVVISEDAHRYAEQPPDAAFLDLVRAWKERA